MQHVQNAFTLIELMIVVAVIGILAAMAVPAYQDYIARAQVTEAIVLLDRLQTYVVEYHAENGTYPSEAEVLSNGGVPTLPTKYVKDIGGRLDPSGAYLVIAQMQDTGINDRIKSKNIYTFTDDGGKTWACQFKIAGLNPSASSNLPSKYLPTHCK